MSNTFPQPIRMWSRGCSKHVWDICRHIFLLLLLCWCFLMLLLLLLLLSVQLFHSVRLPKMPLNICQTFRLFNDFCRLFSANFSMVIFLFSCFLSFDLFIFDDFFFICLTWLFRWGFNMSTLRLSYYFDVFWAWTLRHCWFHRLRIQTIHKTIGCEKVDANRLTISQTHHTQYSIIDHLCWYTISFCLSWSWCRFDWTRISALFTRVKNDLLANSWKVAEVEFNTTIISLLPTYSMYMFLLNGFLS